MDKSLALPQLNTLLDKINEKNKIELEVIQYKKKLDNEFVLTAVENFDKENKQKYIIDMIGEKPIKPKGLFNKNFLISPIKKTIYKRALKKYQKKYSEAEIKYYEDYGNQRSEIEKEEYKKYIDDLKQKEINFNDNLKKLENLNDEINNNNLISYKLKSVKIIKEIISYFEEHRADNLKEAINLYYEESHRKKLENFIKEQLNLTKKVTQQTEEAIKVANESVINSSYATYKANQAMDEAIKSYNTSINAKNEAETAFFHSISNM